MTTAAERERADNERLAAALSFPDPSAFVHGFGGTRRVRLSPRRLVEQWALPRMPRAAYNLYLHVPFCKSICSFCNYKRLRVSSPRSLDDFVSFMVDEARLFAPAFEGVELSAVYVGGGTPSVLSAPQLERLLGAVHESFRFVQGAQKNFEYDPLVMTEDRLAVLTEFGFTRLSFGIQSTDVDVNRLHNRGGQGRQHVARQFEMLDRSGPKRVNVDFLLGLAGTTPEGIVAEIEEVLSSHGPDEVSIYLISPTAEYVGKHFDGDHRRYEQHLAAFEQRVPKALGEIAPRVGYRLVEAGKHMLRMERTTPRSDATGGEAASYCDVPSQVHRPLYLLGLGDSARSRIFGRWLYHAEHDTDDRDPDSPRYVGIPMELDDEVFAYVSYVLRDGDLLDRALFRQTFGADPERLCGPALEKLVDLGVARVDEAGVTLVSQSRRDRLRDMLFFMPSRRRGEARAVARSASRPTVPVVAAPILEEDVARLLAPLVPGASIAGAWRVASWSAGTVTLERDEPRAALIVKLLAPAGAHPAFASTERFDLQYQVSEGAPTGGELEVPLSALVGVIRGNE